MQAFLAVQTQWNVVGGAGGTAFVGFDYAGVRVGLRARGIAPDAQLWGDLQVMEIEVVNHMNGARA